MYFFSLLLNKKQNIQISDQPNSGKAATIVTQKQSIYFTDNLIIVIAVYLMQQLKFPVFQILQ
jgi:hypothetical protein